MRFCTSCQSRQPDHNGESPKGFRGWRCQKCVEKRSESIYKNKSGRIADVRKILDDLSKKNKQEKSV
jgi:hypothetical protein